MRQPETQVIAFCRVPDFAKGKVRDLRVRWALEEIGRPYSTELLDAFDKRPADYLAVQPFGQVPALREGELELFESGAILLYLGEQDERLLPRETQSRWQALTWLFAGLSSVEPALMQHVWLTVFNAGKDWAEAAAPDAAKFASQRLRRLEQALGNREWLGERFSIADIMMVTILRVPELDQLDAEHPALAAYRRRGEARPAFQRALAAQLADLGEGVAA